MRLAIIIDEFLINGSVNIVNPCLVKILFDDIIDIGIPAPCLIGLARDAVCIGPVPEEFSKDRIYISYFIAVFGRELLSFPLFGFNFDAELYFSFLPDSPVGSVTYQKICTVQFLPLL